MPFKPNYCTAVVICHGRSEWYIARYISTNLHLNVKPFAKDKGAHSIQITGLMNILKARPFKNRSCFLQEYPVAEEGKGKQRSLLNFKLFIIMDTDDCTEKQKDAFLSKELFAEHWLYDYIVPIANIPDLEKVLQETGFLERNIHKGEKVPYYERIFPINQKPVSYDTIKEVQTFRQYIAKSKNSNMTEYIDYCLSLI